METVSAHLWNLTDENLFVYIANPMTLRLWFAHNRDKRFLHNPTTSKSGLTKPLVVAPSGMTVDSGGFVPGNYYYCLGFISIEANDFHAIGSGRIVGNSAWENPLVMLKSDMSRVKVAELLKLKPSGTDPLDLEGLGLRYV